MEPDESPVLVLDNFLHEFDRREILMGMKTTRLKHSYSSTWYPVFKATDGNHIRGENFFYHRQDSSDTLSCAQRDGVFLENFARKIQNLLRSDVTARFIDGNSWDSLMLCPYLYPAGTGLSWHVDSLYALSIIYYMHANWDADWGGELLVSPDKISDTSLETSASVMLSADPRCIFPKPNRLVLLNTKHPHSIRKVDPAIGSGLRQSLAGFIFSKSQMRSA